jgi:hypothetical protein
MLDHKQKEHTMDINQITHAIMFGNLDNDKLNAVVMAVKYAREQLTKQKRRALAMHDTVKFTDRAGRTQIGTVQKIAQKYVTVKTTSTQWRVSANMLEIA